MKDRMYELLSASGVPEHNAYVELDLQSVEEETDPLVTFFKDVEKTKIDLKQLEEKIQLIAEKHSQALTAISEEQGQQPKEELDLLMEEVTRVANRIRKVLKAMDQEIKDIPESEVGLAGTRIRKQQHAALSRSFVDVMQKYNDVQTKCKAKYRERVKRLYRIVKPEATEEAVDAVLDNEGGDSIFAQEILSQGHAEAKQALEDIQDRHKDIVKLEKSIKELHELFLDMAMMVNQQGEMIDRIEFQVSESSEYVEDTVVILKEAVTLQSSARKKKIIVIVVVLILIAIAVGVIVKLAM